MADRLSSIWGQQVVVDNRAGASGTLGAGIAAHAAPDGYSLFQCNIASNAIVASLYAKLPVVLQVLTILLPPQTLPATLRAFVLPLLLGPRK
jgi:tripartite-type tricarboxylate transporter receptor subunit TctC